MFAHALAESGNRSTFASPFSERGTQKKFFEKVSADEAEKG